MTKEEILSATEGHNPAAFIELIKQYGSKQSKANLAESLIELNRTEHNALWSTLYALANTQLIKLIQEPDLSQQTETNVETNSPPGNNFTTSSSQDPTQRKSRCGPQDGAENIEENIQDETGNTQVNANQEEPYNEEIVINILKFSVIYLNTIKGPETYIPDKLLELAILLHGMVIMLPIKTQERVVSLCETWWILELEERELLISGVLPILIRSAMSKSGRKKDVVGIYKLREALHLVKFDESLTSLLVATAANPCFICCEEGVKWISELFGWQMLVLRVHRSIKSVLPQCTRTQSAKYAEVYFRAWKKSEGHVKQMIEENCLQDLMYSGVHVNPVDGSLSANLHHLLHHVHRHKRHHMVEKTILKLYDPFLWRSLTAANGYVRMNATGLLCDAFPLGDSSFSLEEREELLDKQYQTILSLLSDPCHLVRITAIKGICNILNNYWLIIPSQVIKAIFQKLLADLLCDASSAEVRTQVIKGFTLLLDNNDAIPFLKEVLPRISNSFDDISASVRIAFVKMLLKVKALKIIRYWSIVPVKHLLHSLESDVPAVCKLLTQLLLNSLHPAQRDDQELLQRCLSLLEENRAASRRFYQYASRTLDLPNTVHFMLIIWHCLRNFIVSQQYHNSTVSSTAEVSGDDCSSNTSSEGQPLSNRQASLKNPRLTSEDSNSSRHASAHADNKENKVPRQRTNIVQTSHMKNYNDKDESDDEDNPLENPTVVGGLLDTVVILWSTNAHRLAQSQNLKYLEALRVKISKSMPLFFKFFKENKDVSQTLLYLSSFLPKSMVPTLVGHCLSRLRSLQQNETQADSCVTYVNALCNWNRVDDVLELASDWLVEGFNSAAVPNTPKERRRSRLGVRFHESYTAQPSLALHLIQHILQHPLNKIAALNKNRNLVLELANTLKASKDLISERLNHVGELSSLCSDKFLCDSFAQYLTLIAVLHNPGKEDTANGSTNQQEDHMEDEEERDVVFDSCDHMHDCLDWANSCLVPVLSGEEVGEKRKYRAGEDAVNISLDALKCIAATSKNLIIIGAADVDFVYRIMGCMAILLKSEKSEAFWGTSLTIAMESYQFLHAYGVGLENTAEELTNPVNLINACITSIAQKLQQREISPQEFETLEKTLSMVLTTLGQLSRTTQNEILQHLAVTIVDQLCTGVDKMKGVDCDIKSVKEMGCCLSLLIGVCQSRVRLSNGFMEALTDVTEASMSTTDLLAISHLLKVLSQDSGKISPYNLKQAVVSVDNMTARVLLPIYLDDSNDSNNELNIQEVYSKTTKEIVDDLKSSLGIV